MNLFDAYLNNDFYYCKFNLSNFNQAVNLLPSFLKVLIFGFEFNQTVSNLPPFLNVLEFSCKFDQNINLLPLFIKFLTFNCVFDQKVNNLPSFLKVLTFGRNFNQIVQNLPPFLKVLILGQFFNQVVDSLPCFLTHLTLGGNFDCSISIPFSVRRLQLDCANRYIISNLSNNITELKLGHYFNSIKLIDLPTSIKRIIINRYIDYNEDLNCLPNSIELIQLPYEYNKKISILPKRLKKIICSNKYKFISDLMNMNILIETYD